MDKYFNQINRAQMLMSQERWDLAEDALRSAISEDPDRGSAYSLLAIIRSQKKSYDEAQQLVERGLAMSPDDAYSHYALSIVLYDRDKYKPAREAIDAALSIEPYDPDLHAHKGAVAIQQYEWDNALQCAETGLQFDPDHVQCNNVRAIALTKMGRREEAGATIDSALAANPEDALSHANMGWTKLHGGLASEAAEHFKEALRLDPDNDWARQGIIESLKAKSVIYRQFLRYMLWVSRFSARTQMLTFIGIIVLLQVLVRMPQGSVLEKIGVALAIVYMAFVSSIWLASPLFDLLLRFSRYGRMVLTPEKRADTNYMAVALVFVGLLLTGPLLTGFKMMDVVGYTILMIPVAVALNTPRAAQRKLAAAVVITIFVIAGIYACRWYVYPGINGLNGPSRMITFLSSDPPLDDPRTQQVIDLVNSQLRLYPCFLWGSVGMSWLGGWFQKENK